MPKNLIFTIFRSSWWFALFSQNFYTENFSNFWKFPAPRERKKWVKVAKFTLTNRVARLLLISQIHAKNLLFTSESHQISNFLKYLEKMNRNFLSELSILKMAIFVLISGSQKYTGRKNKNDTFFRTKIFTNTPKWVRLCSKIHRFLAIFKTRFSRFRPYPDRGNSRFSWTSNHFDYFFTREIFMILPKKYRFQNSHDRSFLWNFR